MEALTYGSLLLGLVFAALAIARATNLFTVVALGSIYSFLMALALLVLDAPDVSMTEASVGAGVSTVLLLGTIHLTHDAIATSLRVRLVPLALVTAVGMVLSYGVMQLPPFGDDSNPIHQHVAPRYLEKSVPETNVPNVVTSVLASYRGFDTLGETTVIFTAGIGILLLLRGSKPQRNRRRREP